MKEKGLQVYRSPTAEAIFETEYHNGKEIKIIPTRKDFAPEDVVEIKERFVKTRDAASRFAAKAAFAVNDHAMRALTMGGSDAGAAGNVNRYKTRLELWFEKTGKTEPVDLSNVEHVQWGNRLEDVGRDYFGEVTNRKVHRSNITHYHPNPKFKFMVAHVDGIQKANHEDADSDFEGNRLYEGKCTGPFTQDFGEPGTDEVPPTYQYQAWHYLAVLPQMVGLDWGVLVAGNQFKIYSTERDEEIIEMIESMEYDFWNNFVLADVMPKPATHEDMKLLWPKSTGNSVVGSMADAVACQQIKEIDKKMKDLTERKKAYQFQLKEILQDSDTLLNEEGEKLVTWKTRDTSKFDAKAFGLLHRDLHDQFVKVHSIRTFLIK